MKAGANELCRVETPFGPSWANPKLWLEVGPCYPITGVWWRAVHHLRGVIFLKDKGTRRVSLCILQLVSSVSAALTGNGIRSTGFWGRVVWALCVCADFPSVRLVMEPHLGFPPPPETGMDAFWSPFSSGTSELELFSWWKMMALCRCWECAREPWGNQVLQGSCLNNPL